MTNLIIRPMELGDINRILEIERDCFTTPWSRESFIMEVEKNKLARYLVAELHGIVVGYGGMWLIVGEAHITNIAVISSHRKLGIGKMILEGLVEICQKLEVESMTLEVRESNLPAQNLYKKYGFEPYGIRPNYYQDDNEDAIIMWKKLEDR